MPFFNTVEACRMATHTLAMEGGVFVLLASMTQTGKGLKANGLIKDVLPGEELPHTAVQGGGFTVVIAPDGRRLTEPVPADWEGLIYSDLNFDEIYKAKQWVDPVGHYSRPDLFTLLVKKETKRHVVTEALDSEYDHVSRFPELED